MNECEKIDRALNEMLVGLGTMVLRMASPQVTRTGEERQALAQSVRQYSVCAERSSDPRVHQLKVELEDSLRPKLRLVASR